MTEEAVKKWYLVYTKPRQERTARTNLERQGYEIYLALTRERRRQRGQRVQVIAPMFPRYLFIHLDRQGDNWNPIRSTIGVVSLVRFAHSVVPVPDDLIDVLRAREDAQGIFQLPEPGFRRGSRLRITEGTLAGYEGIFLAENGQGRVVILLDVMGKRARTTVDAGTVEPAG